MSDDVATAIEARREFATRDRSDALIVQWSPVRGTETRLRFEPRSDQLAGGDWLRVVEMWTGCDWRHCGSDVVESVAIKNGSDAEYIETLISECPECGEEVPGHVTGDEYAGVYGWECPACETTTEPTALGWSRRVEVEGVSADA